MLTDIWPKPGYLLIPAAQEYAESWNLVPVYQYVTRIRDVSRFSSILFVICWHIIFYRVLPWIPWPLLSCIQSLFFRVFPCASMAKIVLAYCTPLSKHMTLSLPIYFRSYFSVFFRGFRGHYDLAFIFSSVYFRVFPWLKNPSPPTESSTSPHAH